MKPNSKVLKISYLLILSVFISSTYFLYSCTPPSEKLRIATAANLQFVMPKLVKIFERQIDYDCEFILGSSGKLTAQIQAGAPYDVFVSADLKYPTELFNNGFTSAPPQVYTRGKLVLWTTDNSLNPDLKTLTTPAVRHIATANPQTAPYGRAAIETLEHFQLLKEVEDKLVYGESIAQTNQFVMTGAAEMGFTAKSVVVADNLKQYGKWIEIDAAAYQPIEQGVVVIKNSDAYRSETSRKRHEQATAFVNFLLSKEAQKILKNSGYE